jgi:hypothetical protein
MARGVVADARDDPEVLVPAAFIIGQAANYTNLRTRVALLGLLERRGKRAKSLSQLLAILPGLTFSRARHQIEVVQSKSGPSRPGQLPPLPVSQPNAPIGSTLAVRQIALK